MSSESADRLTQLETKVPPLFWFLISAGIMWVIAEVSGEQILGDDGDRAATILFFLGVVIAVLGLVKFGTQRTSIDPHNIDKASSLVTGGIYRFSRNPMYFGMLIILIGWARSLGSLIALVVGIVFYMTVLTVFQIIPEERLLEKKFGKQFRAYTEKTRRWI